jgi:hypothetical protein
MENSLSLCNKSQFQMVVEVEICYHLKVCWGILELARGIMGVMTLGQINP